MEVYTISYIELCLENKKGVKSHLRKDRGKYIMKLVFVLYKNIDHPCVSDLNRFKYFLISLQAEEIKPF